MKRVGDIMRAIRSIVAAVVLFVAASTAQAALVYGSSATVTSLGAATQTGATANMNGNPGADQAVTIFRYNPGNNTTTDVSIQWSFTTPPTSIGWTLYLKGTTVRANVVSITLTDTGANTVTSNNTQVIGQIPSNQFRNVALSNFDSPSDYSAGAFDFTNITTILVTFRLTSPSTGSPLSQIQIDAIANPEPGTVALFGLGGLGLVGLVARRRRRAAAARG